MAANGILLPGADDAQASLYISICCGAQSICPDKKFTVAWEAKRTHVRTIAADDDNHYKPQRVVIAERFRFNKWNQGDNESVADYIVALKQRVDLEHF